MSIGNELFGNDTAMGNLLNLPKNIFETGMNMTDNLLDSGSKIFGNILSFMENPFFMLAVGIIGLVLIFKFF